MLCVYAWCHLSKSFHNQKEIFWLTFKFNISTCIVCRWSLYFRIALVCTNIVPFWLARSRNNWFTSITHNVMLPAWEKRSVFPKRRQNALNMWHPFNICLRACSIFPELESTSVIKWQRPQSLDSGYSSSDKMHNFNLYRLMSCNP